MVLNSRGFSQRMVEELAEFSGVPVWNGLTDEWHPTQMLADYLTVQENFGRLEGLTLVYCGDGRNNVAKQPSCNRCYPWCERTHLLTKRTLPRTRNC